MRLRRVAIALGVGGTAFLLATVAGFEVIGSDFPSVFYVLPIALVAAVLAAVGAGVLTGRRLEPPILGLLAGLAAFGGAVFLQLATRYAVASTRRALQVDVIALLAGLAAVLVAAYTWYDETRSRP